MRENQWKDSGTDRRPRAGALYDSSTLINVGPCERIASLGIGSRMIRRGMHHWEEHPVSNLFRLVAGSYLVYRGISGNCPISATMGKQIGDKHASSINIRLSSRIRLPRELVYRSWRQLEKLPEIFSHIRDIRQISHTRSAWTLRTPRHLADIRWESEIVEDVPGRSLSWRSVENSMIENVGKVRFIDLGAGQTLLDLVISYRAPGGYIGSGIAGLLNPLFRRLVRKDISHFRKRLESISPRQKLSI